MKVKEYSIKKATIEDIDLLVEAHQKMFEEILKGELHQEVPIHFKDIEKSYHKKLQEELENKSCVGVILELDGRVIASGAVSFISLVPNLIDTHYKVGFVHSIYTEEDCRGKGYAKMVLEEIIKICQERGIHRIQLNASQAGKTLYKKLGFEEKSSMVLKC